jgi:hypothetical protein
MQRHPDESSEITAGNTKRRSGGMMRMTGRI